MIENIKSPEDLKRLKPDDLVPLAEEIRKVVIKGVSETGGHLASNLGVVELTLALHYVFNTPSDKIVWDVGHQSYIHKLLTGRFDRFDTLRTMGGISGFPKISESPYDSFGTGHSSTSISAAVGLASARDIKGERHKVVAVIGDGAMTAGLAFEGLNHAGHLKKDLIVILNDNEMSISKNVGALSAYLSRILTGDLYRKLKRDTKQLLENIPRFGGQLSMFAAKFEETFKGLLLPGVIFEELGFEYIGPIDGHDSALLIETFMRIKTGDHPVLVHIFTKKGKGYEFSEKDPSVYHGVGPFELETGSQATSGGSFSDAFGQAVVELAEGNPKITAISAAMTDATGLGPFSVKYPGRFFDVGIAELHAVTFSAGLAAGGLRPVVAIYSTFLQRGYDGIIHDVCLQNLPVVFAIDRAGLVGEDGPTHHGAFDLSFLRHIPNLVVMAPKDGEELKAMLAFSMNHNGPSAIRYPRGKAISLNPQTAPIESGKSEIMMEGSGITIIAVGNMVAVALDAARLLLNDGVRPTVVNARFVKPLDIDMLKNAVNKSKHIMTIEDNALRGGFGSAVLEALSEMNEDGFKFHALGLPDSFVEHGSQAQLRKKLGLDAEGIRDSVISFLKK